MPGSPIDDGIEIEQLLARDAVDMTKDDVAVMEVFAPDGSYSAFGDTSPVADLPTLVTAVPSGVLMVGTPAHDPARPQPGPD